MPEEQHCLAAKPALCRGSWGLCAGPPDLSPGPTPCPALGCVLCPVLLLSPRICWGGSAGAQGGSGCPGAGWDFWVPSRAVHGGHIPGSKDCPHGSPVHLGAGGCWCRLPRAAARLLQKQGDAGAPGTDPPRWSTAEHPCRPGPAMGAGGSGIHSGREPTGTSQVNCERRIPLLTG